MSCEGHRLEALAQIAFLKPNAGFNPAELESIFQAGKAQGGRAMTYEGLTKSLKAGLALPEAAQKKMDALIAKKRAAKKAKREAEKAAQAKNKPAKTSKTKPAKKPAGKGKPVASKPPARAMTPIQTFADMVMTGKSENPLGGGVPFDELARTETDATPLFEDLIHPLGIKLESAGSVSPRVAAAYREATNAYAEYETADDADGRQNTEASSKRRDEAHDAALSKGRAFVELAMTEAGATHCPKCGKWQTATSPCQGPHRDTGASAVETLDVPTSAGSMEREFFPPTAEGLQKAQALAAKNGGELYTRVTSGEGDELARGEHFVDSMGYVVMPPGQPEVIDLMDEDDHLQVDLEEALRNRGEFEDADFDWNGDGTGTITGEDGETLATVEFDSVGRPVLKQDGQPDEALDNPRWPDRESPAALWGTVQKQFPEGGDTPDAGDQARAVLRAAKWEAVPDADIRSAARDVRTAYDTLAGLRAGEKGGAAADDAHDKLFEATAALADVLKEKAEVARLAHSILADPASPVPHRDTTTRVHDALSDMKGNSYNPDTDGLFAYLEANKDDIEDALGINEAQINKGIANLKDRTPTARFTPTAIRLMAYLEANEGDIVDALGEHYAPAPASAGDGTSGQDRDNYTDDQDRENYTVDDEGDDD